MSPNYPMVWIAIPVLAGLASLVFILVLTPFAERLRLIDEPDHRKRHGASVPMVGGIAIYLVILSAMMVLDPPQKLSWLMLSVSVMVAVGALDDAFGLGVKTRFAAQVLASVLMVAGGGFWIQSLGFEFVGLGSIAPWLGIVFTVFAVVGLTNGFNMVDGIDGLASGHMLIGLATVGLTLFGVHGNVHQIEWLVVLFSTVFAFWLVNLSLTPLKRVFLGDAGSLLLGFIMAWTLIYYTQKPVALLHPMVALWCVTIPVFDTVVIIARRLKNKRSPFAPDRNHLHHLLVDLGIQPRVTLALILVISISLNAFGVWITYAISPVASLVAYGILLIGFGYAMLHPSIERKVALKLRLID